ncbi:hypothetical protein X777_14957 [Ooceraea biroi]|uniref:Uncharacterized protein n=1 Tax=Ooceraea biroi TaxID=2015173 RepID=A0A026WS58_OOCBI|nr:hypothetical protein X777_14957 [Ooceraea biroi]
MILWTDEATFTRRGIFNSHNSHVWAHNNPHTTRQRNFQHEFRCNVWMGMLHDRLIFIFVKKSVVTYLIFLFNIGL